MYATLKIDLYQYAFNNPERRYGYNEELHPLIDQHVIQDYTKRIPWMIQFESALKTSTSYKTTSNRDIKKLSGMFHLDGYRNLPLNLLGVVSK